MAPADEETDVTSESNDEAVESNEETAEDEQVDSEEADHDVNESDESDESDDANDADEAKSEEADESDDEDTMDGDVDDEAPEELGRDEMRQALYALLFASDRPMNPTRLAEAISDDMDPEVVTMIIEELQEDINGRDELPYFLKEIGGGYQLMTKSAYAPFIRRLYQIKKSKRLSKAVLETLAIIAYKQPTTRAEVEAIRGVSVSHAFEQLQEKRFIKVSGIADSPGRPKLYRTTEDFLLQFGMGSLKELPTLEELQEMR